MALGQDDEVAFVEAERSEQMNDEIVDDLASE